MTRFRLLSILLSLVLLAGLFSACSSKTPPVEESVQTAEAAVSVPAEDTPPLVRDTLTVGLSGITGSISPFFFESSADQSIAMLTQLPLISLDRAGEPVLNGIEGEQRSFNGTDYFYDGIADLSIVANEDGSVDYNITLRDDIVYADGDPMTIDDLIFTMYVLCDPSYDGRCTLYGCPIAGLEEYRSGMTSLSSLILSAGENNTDFTRWTQEQQERYWDAFRTGGEAFCRSIIDYCLANCAEYGAVDFASAAALWGYECADTAAMWNLMVEKYGCDLSDDGINADLATDSVSDFINAALGEYAADYAIALAEGESVPSISGLIRTGDYSMTVHATRLDATMVLQFLIPVAPLHYYGDAALYDYENSSFGFPKGDLRLVRAGTARPMGGGAFRFASEENDQITLEANGNYWKGEPEIRYITFREAADAEKLGGVADGLLDISEPAISAAAMRAIRDYNGSDSLDGDVIAARLMDHNGYGYMALCADNVRVGEDSGSTASRNLRKGLATVLAVYRDAAVSSYYGECADVIQYPITDTSWAAPSPDEEGYETAYSIDVDGNLIYTDTMSEAERCEAALQAAIGFFKAAGYTFDESAGLFTAAPTGGRLSFEFRISAGGVGDHPAFGIVTNASEALSTIGFELRITDLADSADLWADLDAGTVDMWAASWDNSLDPDLYQVYHSAAIESAANRCRIADPALDELIVAGRSSADRVFRKNTCKQALDLVLDWGVEIPTYQRKDCVIFAPDRVNMDTVTPDITAYWSWMNASETLALK